MRWLLLLGVACRPSPQPAPAAPDTGEPVVVPPAADTGAPPGADEEGCTSAVHFPDRDGDGYGVAAGSVRACEAPAGTTLQDGDCDDARADVHPGAREDFDGVDDDCDGHLDVVVLDDASTVVRYASGAPARGLGDPDGDGRDEVAVVQEGSLGPASVLLFPAPLEGEVDPREDVADRIVGWERVRSMDAKSDWTGDAQPDLLVYGIDDEGYGAWLFSGPVRGERTADEADVSLRLGVGDVVSSAGDADGDGQADLLLGHGKSGAAYLLIGPVADGATAADAALVVEAGTGDPYQRAFAAGEDLDGDGLPDLVLGESRFAAPSGAGRVRVVGGGATGRLGAEDATAHIVDDGTRRGFGARVIPTGDLDGDGYGDLLVTASDPATLTQQHLVFSGPLRGNSDAAAATAVIVASEPFTSKNGVAAPGDLDGDGAADLVVSETVEAMEGWWFLTDSPNGTVRIGEAGWRLSSDPLRPYDGLYSELGPRIWPLGDVDRDGRADLAVGGDDATVPGGPGHTWLVWSSGLFP